MVEHRAASGRRRAPRLLADQRQRRALVEVAQLPLRRLAVGGIHEDAALEQGAVEVGDQRADVALAVGAAAGAVLLLEPGDEALLARVPARRVALVDRVDG